MIITYQELDQKLVSFFKLKKNMNGTTMINGSGSDKDLSVVKPHTTHFNYYLCALK